jgi:hypothetical protein
MTRFPVAATSWGLSMVTHTFLFMASRDRLYRRRPTVRTDFGRHSDNRRRDRGPSASAL